MWLIDGYVNISGQWDMADQGKGVDFELWGQEVGGREWGTQLLSISSTRQRQYQAIVSRLSPPGLVELCRTAERLTIVCRWLENNQR